MNGAEQEYTNAVRYTLSFMLLTLEFGVICAQIIHERHNYQLSAVSVDHGWTWKAGLY